MARTNRTNLIIGTIAALGTIAVGVGAITVGTSFASSDERSVAFEDRGTLRDLEVNDIVRQANATVAGAGAQVGSAAGADATGVTAPVASAPEATSDAATDTFVPGAPEAAAPVPGAGSEGTDAPRSPNIPVLPVGPSIPSVSLVPQVDDEGPVAELVSVECGLQTVLEFALWSRDGINNVFASYQTWAGDGFAQLTDLGWNRYRLTVFDSKLLGLTDIFVSATDDAGNIGLTRIGDTCNL